jgi:hypothetical protein
VTRIHAIPDHITSPLSLIIGAINIPAWAVADAVAFSRVTSVSQKTQSAITLRTACGESPRIAGSLEEYSCTTARKVLASDTAVIWVGS